MLVLFSQGLEDDKRWQSNNTLCQKKITERLEGRNGRSGKGIEFKIIVDNNQGRSTTENIER